MSGDMNPFDGDGGIKIDGQDVLGTVGGAAGATLGAMVGGPWGAALGSSLGNSLVGGGGISMNSVFGMLGGSGLFAPPGAPGGGGGGGTDAAYQAQLQAALAGADAARYTADQQLKLGQAGIDAQLKMANMNAIGGIVAGAMAANKSNVVRKELMPHEEGAANIASMDLAMKWDKTMEMKIAGYSDLAIQHELQGRSWKPLFRDAEWNTMQMMKMTKQDVLQNAQLFGMKSPSNPTGIAMTEEEYLGMMSMKDPNELLKVDPALAAERNAKYDAWKKEMYASGNDLIVQIFENPQLSGSSIMSMKGKEALIDPRLAPMLQNMNQVNEPYDDLDSQLRAYDAQAKPRAKKMSDGSIVYTDGAGNPIRAVGAESVPGGASGSYQPGKKILGPSFGYNEAMETYNAGRQRIIDEFNRKQHDYENALEQKFKWDDAIDAMTKGEKTKYTDQINKLIDAGLIDRETGRVNGGALKKFLPPELLRQPQFNMYRDLSDAEKNAIRDEYKRLSEIKVDPKLVRTESMGGGVTRKILLNKDGTRAASALEGYVTDATGHQRFMSMSGYNTQDFMNRAGMISGYSPTSSGYYAGASSDMMAGKLEMRSDDNYLAQFNTGQKTKTMSASQKTTGTVAMAPKNTGTPAPKLSMPSNPAASAGGAPLAAGDD